MLNFSFSLKKECAKVRLIIYITNSVLKVIFKLSTHFVSAILTNT